MSMLAVKIDVDYDNEIKKIADFLTHYKAPAASTRNDDQDMEVETDEAQQASAGTNKYMDQLSRIANRELNALTIDLEDIAQFEDTIGDLCRSIKKNARRYIDLLGRTIDSVMPAPTKDISYKDDVVDVITHQRNMKNHVNIEQGINLFPPELTRRYNVYVKPLNREQPLAVREVKGEHLGQLIKVRGIVTRVSDVKPFLQVSAYSCDSCGHEVFQEVKTRQFLPIFECPSEECKTNQSKGQLYMQTRASKFSPFQEVKMQEMADQVPVGHIPRSMTVHVYGTLARSMNPGDIVDVSGIFLPTPYTGFKAIKAGLLTDTFLEAQYVQQLKKQYDAMQFTPEMEAAIEQVKSDPNLYERLSQSIAPEIYGHEDVKKALLLLLVGGVTKNIGDGMKIRGDINVCLMGDPGVAKSQLLKYISKVAPRGVYTTGRGSSGVGLTAAVMRDPVTDEMVLEGGALVLADNGICCIDEFDKMDESDRTAIHEVMEQQTISISKAGINTTLNARTSILAAANPLYGRYNPKISPVENINLPAALLSRFDILFLILDTPTPEDDERLAQHVTHVHMHNTHPELTSEPLDPAMIRNYIAMARQVRPIVPKKISQYIVNHYVRLRQDQKEDDDKKRAFTYTSARTLLGILRISQALARLRFSTEVEFPDVNEALRLIAVSKSTLYDDRSREEYVDATPTSKIYRIIREMMVTGTVEVVRGEILMSEIRDRVFAKGFTESQFMECVQEYEALDVWTRTNGGSGLRFVDTDDQMD